MIATTQLRLSNERCQQLEEMISKLESRQSNQSKSEIESLIERIKQLESELEKQRFSHDSELKITNERCLELTERLRESEKQNSVLKSVPQTAENWRQRFEDSCVKITALVKEQRELRAQLEKAQRNHKQEQQKMTPNQELLLDELEIDNETLKKRNEALVKLVAKLTSLSWDQDNIIQKLKRDVNAGDTNGASNPRSSNNAHKSAGKQSIAWTIPIDQIDRK